MMRLQQFFIFGLLVFLSRHVCAQEPVAIPGTSKTEDMSLEQQTHFKSIAGQLRCPTCTGLSVLDSEAAFSMQIQALVKEQIKLGRSEEQIMDFFTERYGPWILRAPPAKGVNSLAWFFPIALMTLGPLLVWLFFWRRRTENVSHEGRFRTTSEIIDEYWEQISQLKAAKSRSST